VSYIIFRFFRIFRFLIFTKRRRKIHYQFLNKAASANLSAQLFYCFVKYFLFLEILAIQMRFAQIFAQRASLEHTRLNSIFQIIRFVQQNI